MAGHLSTAGQVARSYRRTMPNSSLALASTSSAFPKQTTSKHSSTSSSDFSSECAPVLRCRSSSFLSIVLVFAPTDFPSADLGLLPLVASLVLDELVDMSVEL